MKKSSVILSCVFALSVSSLAAAQAGDAQATSSASQEAAREQRAKDEQAKQAVQKEAAAKVEQAQAVKAKIEEAQQGSRFVRTLTNVQIELTLTDQIGTETPEKKTVSMIVSSGNWGKIRSAGNVFPAAEPPYSVDLNVDARPFVSVDGQVQLEMTVVYSPLKGSGDPKEGPRQRPSGINQSQTVILQSGKPLVISQAADPISARKVIVEVKATVLK